MSVTKGYIAEVEGRNKRRPGSSWTNQTSTCSSKQDSILTKIRWPLTPGLSCDLHRCTQNGEVNFMGHCVRCKGHCSVGFFRRERKGGDEVVHYSYILIDKKNVLKKLPGACVQENTCSTYAGTGVYTHKYTHTYPIHSYNKNETKTHS